jgi:hypothetical protein
MVCGCFHCGFVALRGATIHLPTRGYWVSAMMMGSEMGYPGLARLIGRPESTGDQIIVSNMQVTARRRAAAEMAAAMMRGDVEGVLAALRLLGVRAAVH